MGQILLPAPLDLLTKFLEVLACLELVEKEARVSSCPRGLHVGELPVLGRSAKEDVGVFCGDSLAFLRRHRVAELQV